MGKIFAYSIILATMLLGLSFACFDTTGSMILYAINNGDISTIASSILFLAIVAIFTLGVGASIIIGIYTRQSTESIIVASLCSSLLAWTISDFLIILNASRDFGIEWMPNLVSIIFIPIIIGYFIAIVQWWRGADQ